MNDNEPILVSKEYIHPSHLCKQVNSIHRNAAALEILFPLVKMAFLAPHCSSLDLLFNFVSKLFSCPFTPLSLSINLLGKTLSNDS